LCAAHAFAILRITLSASAPAMIRCHLSVLMGRDKLNIADVARLTGVNRSTITALYRETATRVELPVIEQLCTLFKCSVGDLLEVVPGASKGAP
jgi:putative transcriptional regulator